MGRLTPDIEGITRIIESGRFEEVFRELLPVVCGDFEIKSFELDGGRKLLCAPALGTRYALAARIAHAKCIGKPGVAFGSDDRELVFAAANACLKCGLKLAATLGRSLAQDAEVVSGLTELGAEVDCKTCVELFDHPYAYIEVPFTTDPEYYLAEVEANYGVWPRPALTGVFAGLYGADLIAKLGRSIEACVVPITSGTEAVAVFKALKSTGCRLATCEETVAQEFHTIDTGAYTLATMGANREAPNMSICPELADMWRKNRVLRLGCDRILDVDVSAFDDTGLPYASRRAAALAFEAIDCQELAACN